METDSKLEKMGPIFSNFDSVSSKIAKKLKLLWSALPREIHLISPS